jgi:enoyl-CoA hydratase/carnithine racemase
MPRVSSERIFAGQVLRLSLGQPEGLLELATVDALAEALAPEAVGAGTKLILLATAGRDFCAGSRLDTAQAVARYHALFYRLIELAVPTAVVVRGRCLGPGLELAAFCNFIFAEGSARFGRGEPGGFPKPASLILPLKLGADRASDLVLTATTIDAREAYQRGLVTAWARSSRDLSALVQAWIESHILPKSARSLVLANRVARLSFHAQLRAELPQLERLYVRRVMTRSAAFVSA